MKRNREEPGRIGAAFFLLTILSLSVILSSCAGLKPHPRYNRDKPSDKQYSTDEKESRHLSETGKRKDRSKKSRSQDKLDQAVDDWWGTPYAWGGNRRGKGTDCSGYVQSVMKNVYGISLPRTSAQQFRMGKTVSRGNLKRSDLVFFNTSGKGVSHVGIYLGRGAFTHSSNSDGVTVDRLDDNYYRKRYVGARRIVGHMR